MKFPTSITAYGQGSSTQQSDSSNEDSIRSFKLFLDLITPAEFSTLLRARVGHLLSTWPPHGESFPSFSSTTTSALSGPSTPTFESIQAFAAFFRTHDSPGPSPIELSAATSLSTLRHHLLALQTLLTFLSGRELKDIVRARLSEGGKDRMTAVQGLMDVMRSAGDDRVEVGQGVTEDAIAAGEDMLIDEVEETKKADGPAVATGSAQCSVSKVSKRQVPARNQEWKKIDLLEDGQPPKKRQRIETAENQYAQDGKSSDQISPGQPQSTSQPLSQDRATPSLVLSHPTLPLRRTSGASTLTDRLPNSQTTDPISASRLSDASEQKHLFDLSSQACLNSDRGAGSQVGANSGRKKREVLRRNDVDTEPSDHEAHISKEHPENSDEEDEVGGLVVTLIDEEAAPAPGRQPGVPHTPEGHSVSAKTSPSSTHPTPPTATVTQVSGTNLKPGREQLLSPPLSADLSPGVSREESNRRRMRAALGLPPKDLDNDGKPGEPPSTSTGNAGDAERDQPQGLRHLLNPGTVPGTSESALTTPVKRNSSSTVSHKPSFESSRVHPPVSSFPRPDRHVSRSPPPPLDDSDLDDDRASPPGPVLRAVDWATGVMPVSTSADVEVDELEGDDVFIPTPSKPSNNGYTGTSFANRHAQVAAWPAGGEIVDWVDDGEHEFGAEANESKGSARKLFIRLPARPKGHSKASGATVPDADASAPASPVPPSSLSRISPLFENGGQEGGHNTLGTVHATRPPGLPTSSDADMEGRQSPSADIPKSQLPTNAGSKTPPPTSADPSSSTNAPPSRPHSQPQMQMVPISRTQSASPSMMQMQHMHPHPLQHPPGAYVPQAPPAAGQPFPGPWFGAMFYVPLRRIPHIPRDAYQPPPHLLDPMHQRSAHPKMQTPTAGPSKQSPTSPRTGEQGLGSASASAPPGGSGPSTPNLATVEGLKRGPKRKSSTDPPEPNDPSSALAPMEIDPDMTYTDDVGVKETPTIKRRCFNCLGVHAPSWRKSKLNVGKILCNKCGIYESTHMAPRPLKTRPRRSTTEGGVVKKRKSPKKTMAVQ